MIFGGIYLLWLLRRELSLITVVYGFWGLGILLASGGTISLNRLSYGIVSRRDRMRSAACSSSFLETRSYGFICHSTGYLRSTICSRSVGSVESVFGLLCILT
jgi:hypothetical protein